jgi:hypothetical protein
MGDVMKRKIIISIVTIAVFILAVVLIPNAAPILKSFAQTTPSPRLPLAELKYRLLEHFGTTPMSYPGDQGIFFCDWYAYPTVRPNDEKEDAIRVWPDITKNIDAYQAILKRLNMQSRTSFTDDEKLRFIANVENCPVPGLISAPIRQNSTLQLCPNPTSITT